MAGRASAVARLIRSNFNELGFITEASLVSQVSVDVGPVNSGVATRAEARSLLQERRVIEVAEEYLPRRVR